MEEALRRRPMQAEVRLPRSLHIQDTSRTSPLLKEVVEGGENLKIGILFSGSRRLITDDVLIPRLFDYSSK